MASAHAALQLAALGFFARHMNTGLSEWTAAGLATHQGSVAQGETACECTRGAPLLADASRPQTSAEQPTARDEREDATAKARSKQSATGAESGDASQTEETSASAKPETARRAGAKANESDAPPAYGPAQQPTEDPPRAPRATSVDAAKPDAPQESAALQESFEEPKAPKEKAPGTRARPPDAPPRRASTNAPRAPGSASAPGPSGSASKP